MLVNGSLNFATGGQIATLRAENRATDPASPFLGQVWFNTTAKCLKYNDGVEVQQIAIGGNLSAYIRHDGTVAMTGQLVLFADPVNANHASNKNYVDTGITALKNATDAAELAIDTAVGLNTTTHAYVADGAANYIAGATSVLNATQLLDSRAKTNADNIATNTNDISTLFSTKVAKAGDTMTGNLTMSNAARIRGLLSPVNPDEPTTRAYVEAVVSGLDFQADVLDIQLDATLDPGATPVARTLTKSGDRYIITDKDNLHANFGTIAGLVNNDIVEYIGGAFVVDYDTAAKGAGAIAWDRAGHYFAFWNGTIWDEFGGLTGVTAGAGLEKSHNTIYVNFGAGISQLPTDQLGIDIRTDSGLWLTADGLTASTTADSQIAIRLANNSLETIATGIKIKADGVTEVELKASSFGNGLQGGSGTVISVKPTTGILSTASGVGVDVDWADNRYVNVTGDTLTGPLVLAADPTAAAQASNKNYVDTNVAAINDTIDALTTRLEECFFLYDGSVASDTHVVTHNLGTQFANVTIIDPANNEVVMPNSIVFDSTTTLTVNFGSVVACKVFVSGLKVPAAAPGA